MVDGCPATTVKEKTHMWRRDARERWVLELWRWRAQGGVAVYMRNFEVYEEFVAGTETVFALRFRLGSAWLRELSPAVVMSTLQHRLLLSGLVAFRFL